MVDVYEIDLAAGQYLHATVDQLGIDVEVNVFAPGRRPLFQIDGLTGAWGAEEIHLVAAKAGRYRLEVVPEQAGPGRYLARLEALRPATTADAIRAAAERALCKARGWDRRVPPPTAAAAELERSAHLFSRVGAVARQAEALYELGKAYLNRHRPGEALAIYRTTRALYCQVHDRVFTALADNQLGKCYAGLGELDLAVPAYESALTAWRQQPVDPRRAVTLENLGDLRSLQGRLADALRLYNEAIEVSHQLGDRASEAKEFITLGWTYRSAGELERAREAYWRAAGLYRKGRDWHAAVALSRIGDLYREAGEPRRALPFFERALKLEAGAAADAGARIATLSGLGISYQLLEEYDKALPLFDQAVEIYQFEGGRPALANAWINLGSACQLMKQWDRAAGCYRRARALAHASGFRSAEALALRGIAACDRDRGRLDAALAGGEAALAIVEVARADLRSSYMAANGEYCAFLIDVLMRLDAARPGQGFALRALAHSERARARDLLGALVERREAAAAAAVPPALVAEREALKRQIAGKDLALRQAEAAPGVAVESGRRAELQCLIDRLHQMGERLQRPAPPRGPDLSAFPGAILPHRELLDERTLLLEYYMTPAKTFLWAATPRALESFELPGRERLEPLLRSVYEWFAGDLPADRREEAAGQVAQLSEVLLGPVAGRLGDRRLLIVANGPLQSLPFAALIEPGRGAMPLVRHHEILTAPSLAVLAELRARQRSRPPAAGILVVADPVFGGQDERLPRLAPDAAATVDPLAAVLPRLPETAAEATAIAALAGQRLVRLAEGFDASRDLLAGGKLRDYDLVHFATHGTLRFDRPELSALTLSMIDRNGRPRDGLLRVGEIADLDFAARLVVLSACKTALGREQGDEGLIGLPQAFMKAGASRVLVSLWDVGDRSTAELMRRFYHALLIEKQEPAAALRAAQCALERDPRWRLPRYWAGFVLAGDWR
jgi:CHAT domain-containing protein/tetratricopeptide (TPR) repeat protein